MQDNPQENDTGDAAPDPQPQSSSTAPPPAPASGSHKPRRTVLVRYGKMGFVGQFRHSERDMPPHTTHVVVHTSRGIELGEIIAPFCHHRGSCTIAEEKIDSYCAASGPDYPLSRQGRVIRFASSQDINEQQHLEQATVEKMSFCRELISKHQLAMHLVSAEHLFGGDRIIYYFMADTRVDFRQLVRELAHQYQTRIEMRQIGARDEARIIADFETCGRECCCKSFLKVLQPVNMRMAKLQKATLDPSKISGRCGRLKCCLRYEDKVYTELRKNTPRNNSNVLTDMGVGVVLETQILTQLVKIRLDTGRIVAIGIDEIQQRDYRPPKPDPVTDSRPQARPKPSEPAQASPPAEGAGADQEQGPRKKRRRRRRRKKKDSDGQPSSGPTANNSPPPENSQ